MNREFETDEVRQGIELGVMRYVLSASIFGAVIAMIAVFLVT